jgi:hypothetical protein
VRAGGDPTPVEKAEGGFTRALGDFAGGTITGGEEPQKH